MLSSTLGVSLQPRLCDDRAVATAQSDTRAVPLIAAHLVYHFDTQAVTERRK
jgi:hypothetical protein